MIKIMKNTPFENLAQMCNVSESELKAVNTKPARRRARVCRQATNETSAIPTTYNAAVKHFKTISNVISIARINKITKRDVVMAFCRKSLDNHNANRVADLVLKAIA